MEEIKLKAEIREGSGSKKALSDLRKSRLVPGVVYGGSGSNLTVVVSEKELLGALKTGGNNAIIHLKHSKGEDTVIVKALQRHVVTSQPIHADFQRIDLKKKIEVKVPLHLVGEAPGVKLQGGVLEHVLREFKVRGLPNAIPQKLDLDISKLEIGKALHVSDVAAPAGLEVLDDAAHIVVTIVRIVEEAAPEAAAAAPGASEPELVATKGKKDEEGAEGAKADAKGAKPDAKAAAKPEAGKKEGK
ncbi:MAG TPA: 50S ribosomal protein L25 [Elusimicrobiota bacterium]|jgi:large subunit ribosomal protein L25|nr:50S ribosomal protein L25 [Elusimicrobiota bacterium]